MKKKVMRLALLLVLPVAAAFVFSAYTGGGADGRCPAVDDPSVTVMFPNPDDCASFFMCSDGVAILMECPEGLHYNADLSVCDWPSSADCDPDEPGSGSKGTATPYTTTCRELVKVTYDSHGNVTYHYGDVTRDGVRCPGSKESCTPKPAC